MVFDIDHHRKTVCPPWEFTTGGQVFVARYVSAPAIEQFLARFNAVSDEEGKSDALLWLLRQAFPDRFSYRWRRDSDPVHRILHLDTPTRQAALADFFGFLGIQVETLNPQTTTVSLPSMDSPVGREAPPTPSRS